MRLQKGLRGNSASNGGPEKVNGQTETKLFEVDDLRFTHGNGTRMFALLYFNSCYIIMRNTVHDYPYFYALGYFILIISISYVRLKSGPKSLKNIWLISITFKYV